MEDYINLNLNNIDLEHLCCIIKSRVKHPGVESKRTWVKNRIQEGHIFRKRNVKGIVFIEYGPLEKAWTPIEGNNYLYVYCLWVDGEFKHQGYGRELLNYCIQDAKEKRKSGICLLGSKRQKHWLTSQDFFKKNGFEVVDSTFNGYDLLALSFDQTYPKFTENSKKMEIESKVPTIYYDDQCPYIYEFNNRLEGYCKENNIAINFIKVESLEQAKSLPCVFNNYAFFYDGKFQTVNLIGGLELSKLISK